MIKVNGFEVTQEHFPDNTLLTKAPLEKNEISYIEWYYENDAELFTLICLRKHYGAKEMELYMPYCPHARMDRVKHHADVFTLKYFAEVINSLNFKRVIICDPHSNVTSALIDNCRIKSPENYIERAIGRVEAAHDYKQALIFYPDEGAMKRYSINLPYKYAFGIKRRDWETGKIEGLDVAGCVDEIKDKVILIVDDICSRGGTFYHSAKKLKELGAKEVYLYVTHCENTILEGELLTSGLIEKVYTTNSIFTKEHEKIEVFEL